MNKELLIIVDYQNDFISPDGQVAKRLGNKVLHNGQALADKIQILINKWHQENRLIIFLISDYSLKNYEGFFKKARSKNAYGDAAHKGTWGHKLYKLKPGPKDYFVIKNYFDGFYKSDLEKFLKKNKVDTIYLCGINTDVCVFHTAIGASIRGYKTFVIEDATETITPYKKIFINYLKNIVGVKLIKLNRF